MHHLLDMPVRTTFLDAPELLPGGQKRLMNKCMSYSQSPFPADRNAG